MKRSEIEAEARRIHRCPPGYDGPCWGPTEADREQVKTAAAASSSGSADTQGGQQ